MAHSNDGCDLNQASCVVVAAYGRLNKLEASDAMAAVRNWPVPGNKGQLLCCIAEWILKNQLQLGISAAMLCHNHNKVMTIRTVDAVSTTY